MGAHGSKNAAKPFPICRTSRPSRRRTSGFVERTVERSCGTVPSMDKNFCEIDGLIAFTRLRLGEPHFFPIQGVLGRVRFESDQIFLF